jgi:hypothetical protein
VLPKLGPYIYDVKISGFTRRSVYTHTTLVGSGLIYNAEVSYDVYFNLVSQEISIFLAHEDCSTSSFAILNETSHIPIFQIRHVFNNIFQTSVLNPITIIQNYLMLKEREVKYYKCLIL